MYIYIMYYYVMPPSRSASTVADRADRADRILNGALYYHD